MGQNRLPPGRGPIPDHRKISWILNAGELKPHGNRTLCASFGRVITQRPHMAMKQTFHGEAPMEELEPISDLVITPFAPILSVYRVIESLFATSRLQNLGGGRDRRRSQRALI